ncbi:hypothetical protein JCM14076_18950 [Methylosoma difficile]
MLGTFIGITAMAYPKYPDLSPEEVAALYTLPDEALLTPAEAAAFLNLKRQTLNWYRCQGGGPRFVKIGSTIRYRVGDLRGNVKAEVVSHD